MAYEPLTVHSAHKWAAAAAAFEARLRFLLPLRYLIT